MRILLVTHYYAPEVGAPQHRWDALVARFRAAGHDVAVLAPSPHYPTGRAGDLAGPLLPGATARGRHGELIHRLRFLEYDGAVATRGLDQLVTALDAVRVGLARFSGSRRPDVVIATVPGLPSIAAGVALHLALRVPLVAEMRDAWPDLLGASHEWDQAAPAGPRSVPRGLAGVLRAAISHVVTAMQRRAAAVVVTTDAFADVLRERGMRRVTVVRNGTHLDEPAVLAAPDPDRSVLRVLYLGTIGRSQGLGAAVRAAAIARDAGTPVHLRIVGEGAETPAVIERAAELAGTVEVLPPVPRIEAAALYAWADTVLVSLRGWEPLRWTVPSKLYEVLGMGRHVSGMLAGEAARIVEETGGGDVVRPGDAEALAGLWQRLQQDRSLLAPGPEPREWVARHADDDLLAAEYLALLEEVVHA